MDHRDKITGWAACRKENQKGCIFGCPAYIHCLVEDMQSAAANIGQCVAAIENWMAANRLRLNADKTELIWTGVKHNLLKIPGGGPSMTLGGVHIKSFDVVRLLGVSLTPNLSMDKHVTSLSAKCFFPAATTTAYPTFAR